MKNTRLIDLFQRSRADQDSAVIEGLQALKHAVRFGAEIEQYITCDINLITHLLDEVAKDVKAKILSEIKEVDEAVFSKLSPQPPRTKVIALAKRRNWQLGEIDGNKPIVFLEDPRDLENIGAVIRVAAAADCAAVIISGPTDIWHPAVIRGAAGLQWALPVFDSKLHPEFSSSSAAKSLSMLEYIQKGRTVIALDPAGSTIDSAKIDTNSILIFGTERHGISKTLLNSSDTIIRLPMKQGVSSLNLATSVAATLYQL